MDCAVTFHIFNCYSCTPTRTVRATKRKSVPSYQVGDNLITGALILVIWRAIRSNVSGLLI